MLLEMLILRGNYFLVSRLIYHYLKLLIGGMGVLNFIPCEFKEFFK